MNPKHSADNTALNKQDDQETKFPLQIDYTIFGALPEHFIGLEFSSTKNPWIWMVFPIFTDSSSEDKDTFLKIKRKVLDSID